MRGGRAALFRDAAARGRAAGAAADRRPPALPFPFTAAAAYPVAAPPAPAPGAVPGAAGAPTSTICGPGPLSRGIRTYDMGIGGADHLTMAGALQSSAAPAPPRGPRTAVAHERAPPGGAATLSLGSAEAVYVSGSRVQERAAADAGNIAAAQAAFVAGARPPAEELGVRRRNGVRVAPSHPVGGHSTIGDVMADGSGLGPGSYAEGIKEAQYCAALSEGARAEAARVPTAGPRAPARDAGVRVTQNCGGTASLSIAWAAEPPPAGGASAAAAWEPAVTRADRAEQRGAPPSPSRRGNGDVGAYSAKFIAPPARAGAPAGAMGALLGAGGAWEGGAGGAHSPRAANAALQQPLGGRGLKALGVTLDV